MGQVLAPLTKEEQADICRRHIPSLAFLLRMFEIKFETAKPGAKYLAQVMAFERHPNSPGRQGCPRDVNILYGIIDFHPKMLEICPNYLKSIHDWMRTFEHDASCGCSGCYCAYPSWSEKIQLLKTGISLAD